MQTIQIRKTYTERGNERKNARRWAQEWVLVNLGPEATADQVSEHFTPPHTPDDWQLVETSATPVKPGEFVRGTLVVYGGQR